MWIGILITAFDVILVLGLKGQGFRRLEAIMLGLVGTVARCFVVQLFLSPPDGAAVLAGMAPLLLLLTADRRLMGRFTSPAWVQALGWLLFAGITAANLWLVTGLFA